MLKPALQRSREFQRGGVTILVTLMLLVLLTIAAIGMAKNSFREVVASGTGRQGAMAKNVADSGVEWSIFWMDYNNSASASGSASNLVAMKAALLEDSTLSGKAWDVMSGTPTAPTSYTPGSTTAVTLPSLTSSSGTVHTQSFSIGVTRMGKLPVADTSQGVGSGAYTPSTGSEAKQAPDLWAIRSDSQVGVAGVNFTHSKEVWISTPVQ
ncbi:hypothetical protein [Holophaga foetida]|uniref:hypothetical protein n=1 Tax=Holophaga foetida TaxID=35839 RepID=UPI0002472F66|nr:hypothetical protein [Holophaga foetida]